MRKLGALDGAMENLGPFALFDDAMWKLETLNKAMGNCGELNDLMRKMGIGALMRQWNINFGAFWWHNGQIRHPSDDEIGAPWWPDREIGALDH